MPSQSRSRILNPESRRLTSSSIYWCAHQQHQRVKLCRFLDLLPHAAAATVCLRLKYTMPMAQKAAPHCLASPPPKTPDFHQGARVISSLWPKTGHHLHHPRSGLAGPKAASPCGLLQQCKVNPGGLCVCVGLCVRLHPPR